MNATLYLPNQNTPIAALEHVEVFEYNDNHTASPTRIYYKTRRLNLGRTMVELFRDERLRVELGDGRKAIVLLQHNSLDMEGNYVGVLRVARWLEPAAETVAAPVAAAQNGN